MSRRFVGHICLHVGELRAADVQSYLLVPGLGAGSRHVHGIGLDGMRSRLRRRQSSLCHVWNTQRGICSN